MEWDAGQRETVIEVIAAACYQQNLLYSAQIGEDPRPSWPSASSEAKDSMISGVRAVLFDGSDPQRLHELWVEHHRKNGWSYGPTRDPEAKTHPCLLPYGDLPEEQKRKDALFVEMVVVLARTSGLLINDHQT